MISLKGHTALITGASRGIGRAIAVEMGRAGAKVAVSDMLIEDEPLDSGALSEYSALAHHFQQEGKIHTRATADVLNKLGSKSLAVRMDVTDPVKIEAALERIKSELGNVDILVNNAAIMESMARFAELEQEDWNKNLQVNLSGAFNCAKAVWGDMKKQCFGRIINISSIAGLCGAKFNYGYGASKAGLIGLTKSLAMESGKYGITVNSITPGFIASESLMMAPEKHLSGYRDRCPMKRLGKPEDIAALAVFLASDKAGFINGATIPVTGGLELLDI